MATYLRYKGPTGVAPTNVTPPSFTGSATVGSTLYGNPGQFSGDPVPSVTVQWYRISNLDVATLIIGAVSLDYAVTADDIGFRMRLTSVGSSTSGTSAPAHSSLSQVVSTPIAGEVLATSFGMKTSKTTGSMNVGEFALTVADASGFAVGDQVIVESNAQPGTKGVGGSWPALIYATKAAMTADLSQPDLTQGSVAGDGVSAKFGSIHRFNKTTGVWNIYNNTEYGAKYYDRAEPFSLVAKITNKAGNVLTLDLPAQISVTSANVFFDNYPLIVPLGTGAGRLQNTTLTFPAGEFAFSRTILFDTCNALNIKGAGKALTKLVSPKCTPSIGIKFYFGTGSCTVSDLTMVGNCADVGYGTGILPTTPQTQAVSRNFVRAIWWERCYNGPSYVNDVDFINPWAAVVSGYSSNVHCNDCDVYSAGHSSYIQWMFLFADHGGPCTATDCRVFADYVLGGFESFYGLGAVFTRCGGVNVTFSNNSGGQFLFDECYSTIKPLSQKSPPANFGTSGFFPAKQPVFNINNNVGNTGGRPNLGGIGEIRNPTIIMEGIFGLPDENPGGYLGNATLQSVIIAPNVPNVRVTGTYGVDTVNPKGYIEMPIVVDDLDARRGIVSDGSQGSVVSGIRIVGGRSASYGKFVSLGTSGGSAQGLIKNVITDVVSKNDALTKINLISNADFNAKGAVYDAWVAAAQANS